MERKKKLQIALEIIREFKGKSPDGQYGWPATHWVARGGLFSSFVAFLPKPLTRGRGLGQERRGGKVKLWVGTRFDILWGSVGNLHWG